MCMRIPLVSTKRCSIWAIGRSYGDERYGHEVTELADRVVRALQREYAAHRDPSRAPAMAAYMRDQFAYLGLSAPEQRRLARSALAGFAKPKEADVRSVAQQLWRLPEREYQYAACDYIAAHINVCRATFLPTV